MSNETLHVKSHYHAQDYRKHKILDACECLHMIANGSMEASYECGDELYAFLTMRLEHWFKNVNCYDELVYLLCYQARSEYRKYRFEASGVDFDIEEVK